MKNIIVAITVIFFGQMASADFSNVKCLSVKETAEELLNIEASGRQHQDSICMTQENFPRYKIGVRMAGGGDSEDRRKPVILVGKKPYQIKSITKDADDNQTVKFDYKLSNGKTIKDELTFVQYQTGELKKLFGCAAITSAPKTLAIHADCLPKN